MGILSEIVRPESREGYSWRRMLIDYLEAGPLDQGTFVVPPGTRWLHASTFRYEAALKKVTVPPSLVSMGSGVFSSSGLTTLWPEGEDEPETGTVVIPGLLTIVTQGFEYCQGIKKAIIREGQSMIPPFAFRSCTKLEEVELPTSLRSIKSDAFSGCSKLTKVVIPEGVTELENWAFKDCPGLTEVILPSTLQSAPYAFLNCTQSGLSIKCRFSEGAVSGAPWGATNATIVYDYEGE